MKDRYTIHEIADLYGIGTDSLRYYERLGLIHPKRGENGYRLYTLGDIYRLTIIRDLRQLDFSTDQIREYLNGLSLEHTLSMLAEEHSLILERQRALQETERSIRKRMHGLQAFRQAETGGPECIMLPERPCVRLNTNISRDEEFDFAIKKLHHLHDSTVRDLGSQTIGASISPEDIDEGRYGLFRSVFFLLPQSGEHDFVLPGGMYARLYYRGSYTQSGRQVEVLRSWLRRNALRECSDILELYHIDNRFTACEEEFFTELQVHVEKTGG